MICNQELFSNSGIGSELYEKIRETYMARGKFEHRYWFFADASNIAKNCSVIYDLWWWADSYRRLRYRGGCTYNTVVSIKYDVKSVSQPYTTALHGNQLWFANNRNRVRGAVLCLSQDGACTNLFENFREYSLKRDLSNDTTDNPPLFSLVNTFKGTVH